MKSSSIWLGLTLAVLAALATPNLAWGQDRSHEERDRIDCRMSTASHLGVSATGDVANKDATSFAICNFLLNKDRDIEGSKWVFRAGLTGIRSWGSSEVVDGETFLSRSRGYSFSATRAWEKWTLVAIMAGRVAPPQHGREERISVGPRVTLARKVNDHFTWKGALETSCRLTDEARIVSRTDRCTGIVIGQVVLSDKWRGGRWRPRVGLALEVDQDQAAVALDAEVRRSIGRGFSLYGFIDAAAGTGGGSFAAPGFGIHWGG